MPDPAPEYVAARRVLLDALTALRGHLDDLILVGAQAIYHHTGDTDLNVPVMTTDADLAINTDRLADVPEIGAVLRQAGFTPGSNPGHWVSVSDVAVDLHGGAPIRPAPRRRPPAPRSWRRTRSAPDASRAGWNRRWWTTTS